MPKTILVTGSTDGIGLEAAKLLASQGHQMLLHGRDPAKLEKASNTVSARTNSGRIESYVADLSRMADVEAFAKEIAERHNCIDVLINNAGVFRTPDPVTRDGLDGRFAVNAIAPFLLTRRLLPLLRSGGRVINVSSAAQAPVDLEALTIKVKSASTPHGLPRKSVAESVARNVSIAGLTVTVKTLHKSACNPPMTFDGDIFSTI